MDGLQARQMLDTYRPEILLLDIKMPEMDGLRLLEEISYRRLPVVTVIISGEGGIPDAVNAIKLGAEDYVEKPVEPCHLKLLLTRICKRLAVSDRLTNEAVTDEPIIGQSPAIQEAMRLVRMVASSTASVIIQGESGTGKELVARTIHRLSPRSNGPYVAINCAAFPDSLIESELFGYERGAFTGAENARKGCFEQAQGGTLLLDELTELKPGLQAKLLRVIEERRLRRVGGHSEVDIDVRLLAATNRDPTKAVGEGILREDLYYRLNVFAIKMPPLRKHPEDILALTDHFINRFSGENQKQLMGADEDCLKALQSYQWPGNARQLRNIVERAVAVARGPRLTRSDLPPEFHDRSWAGTTFEIRVGSRLEDVEHDLITRTIAAVRGNKTRAARMLGISLRTLYNRLARYRPRHHKSGPSSSRVWG